MFDLFGRKKIAELTQELEETDEILDARDLKIEKLEQKIKDSSARAQDALDMVVNTARLRIQELEGLVEGLTAHNAALDLQSKRLVGSVSRYEGDNVGLRRANEQMQKDIVALLDAVERVKQEKRKKAAAKRKAAKKKSKK